MNIIEAYNEWKNGSFSYMKNFKLPVDKYRFTSSGILEVYMEKDKTLGWTQCLMNSMFFDGWTLFPKTEKMEKSGWANLYKNKRSGKYIFGPIYFSKQMAIDESTQQVTNINNEYIDIVAVHWEE